MNSLELKNVSVNIGENSILRNVSTHFKANELTCILGPNGAGKTTLVKSILRLNDFEGEILLSGKNLKALSAKEIAQKISYVPQAISQELNFTVEEFILLSRYPWEGVSQMDKSRLEEILELTGLLDHKDQTVKTLSGGEKQRALIAAALIQDTEVILLDEISSALDPKFQDQIIKLLLEIRDKGKTLIWVTHDINAALLHADSLLALKEAEFFDSGTPEDFLAKETMQKLYDRRFEKLIHTEFQKSVLI